MRHSDHITARKRDAERGGEPRPQAAVGVSSAVQSPDVRYYPQDKKRTRPFSARWPTIMMPRAAVPDNGRSDSTGTWLSIFGALRAGSPVAPRGLPLRVSSRLRMVLLAQPGPDARHTRDLPYAVESQPAHYAVHVWSIHEYGPEIWQIAKPAMWRITMTMGLIDCWCDLYIIIQRTRLCD